MNKMFADREHLGSQSHHGIMGDLHSAQLTSPSVTPFPGVLAFLILLQKTLNSGTCFVTGHNPSFSDRNTHFKGRKMYANSRVPGRSPAPVRHVRGDQILSLFMLFFPSKRV
jgi:hypothetical protein